MARNTIVPITDMPRRAPEAGRIRLGVKSGKAMKSIDTFRFTSPYRDAIEQLAARYGGEVRPWSDPKARIQNQFEVISPVNEIEVFLPRNGLSVWYEKWTGGGCERRCDGVTVEVPRMRGPEVDLEQVPCICYAKGVRECRPYTRLNVVLPNIVFRGTWRLESKGWNAAQELPGMFEMIQRLSESQLVQAVLSVQQRTDVVEGQTRRFIVPSLSVDVTPVNMLGGGAEARAIQATPGPALAAGTPHVVEDDVEAEGEIIDPELLELEGALRGDAEAHDLDPELFVEAVMVGTEHSAARIRAVRRRLHSGEIFPQRIDMVDGVPVIAWEVRGAAE